MEDFSFSAKVSIHGGEPALCVVAYGSVLTLGSEHVSAVQTVSPTSLVTGTDPP